MRQVAPDVWQISFGPRDAVNAYLAGGVLIDAGTAGMGRKLPGRLEGREVTAHAITHAHPDHVGGSSAVCSSLGLELWAPSGDAADVELGKPTPAPGTWATGLMERAPGWTPPPVSRRLAEGDEVGGFTVVDVPGHSPGHVAFWRESDRVLILGDVYFNRTLLLGRPRLSPPVRVLTHDPAVNRESMRKLGALDPEVALFGHGPPLQDAGPQMRSLVAALPS